MAVAFDASSESHTGTAGDTSQGNTFNWTHTPVGSPKGVLVFTFTNGAAAAANGVSYDTLGLVPVSGGSANDTAGEAGNCTAWLLSPWSVAPALVSSATTNTANTLSDVGYDGAYYAAVGASGTVIYRATDPTGSWSSATSGTANELRGVAYGGGYWAAVGASGTVIYKATNPTGTWSSATSGTANALNGAAYGNGYFVAVGASGTIIYKATDPTGSWSSATSGTGNELRSVVYADGYWVAVGASGTIVYKSGDPTGSWSSATSGTANLLRHVAHGNGYFAAAGNGGTIVYKATDPTGTWSSATSGTGASREGIAYGQGYWMSPGQYEPRFKASTPDGSWSGCVSLTDHSLGQGAVRFVGGYFIDVANSGDLSYWSPPTLPLSIPTGAQTVRAMNRWSADETYAVAITVTADYGVEATGVVLQQGDQALANTAVNDGSPGTDSVRFAGVFSGLSAVPSANAGSTELQNIDFGNQVVSVIRETTAGQGSRNIGWTGASDDVAAVYLAIREAIVPWTVGVPIR